MRKQSHTSVKLYQRCAKKYEYKYIRRLDPEYRPAHLERGSRLHQGLALYHTYDPAFADWILDADKEDTDILFRYAEKWQDDDIDWTVEHAEEEFELEMGPYTLRFIPDLVIRHRGELWVVDHKTTANIPDEWDPYNMTDFQHLLYVAGIQEQLGPVAGFMFNYIRTKPPTQPKLIKDGSRIAAVRTLDTDYNTLHEFARKTGQLEDPDVIDKLNILKHSPDRFFQRHWLPVSQSAVQEAVRDTYGVMSEISAREAGRLPGGFPRHVVGSYGGMSSCARCEYQPLCHTELLGIEVDVEVLGYVEREERDG